MVDYTNKEVQEWWIGKAKTVEGYRKNIFKNDSRSADTTVIGKMYLFKYDPKLKQVLPIYDIYPLVFPIEPYSDGFLGINVHYLSGGERLALLNKLREFASNNKNNETTRLKLTYNLLSGIKKINTLMGPCIKRYLFSHVRSRFIQINADEWDKVIQLPLELFKRRG